MLNMFIIHFSKPLVLNRQCLKVNSLELIHLFPFISGAMYMLIRINISVFRDIEDDKDFFTKLLCEESISCLPASVNTCLMNSIIS